MKTYIDGRIANVKVNAAVRFTLDLEPGIWVVREADGLEYSVVALSGLVTPDGIPNLGWPRGVVRRPSGQWAARQVLLHQAVPRNHPRDAWAAVPEHIRHLVEDAYDLAYVDVPPAIGIPGVPA